VTGSAAGFGIATANGAWRAVHRALAQIPTQEADQAREDGLAAQLQARENEQPSVGPISPGSGWAESRRQLLIVSYGRAAAVPVPAYA
jgi:hypothetical protein